MKFWSRIESRLSHSGRTTPPARIRRRGRFETLEARRLLAVDIIMDVGQSPKIYEGEVRTLRVAGAEVSDQPQTVGVFWAGGSADLEFVGLPLATGTTNQYEVTIPPGQTGATFDILALADGLDEEDETFPIRHFNGTEFVGPTLRLVDRDAPAVTLSTARTGPLEAGPATFTITRNTAEGTDRIGQSVVVQLTSSNPNLLSVPSSVRIQTNRTSADLVATIAPGPGPPRPM